ncbi:hypothetical protein Tco_1209164 [Tanacetum coccineum]
MEHARKQQEPKETITSFDTTALIEFDQKTTLFETMTKSKSVNKSLKQRALYHAFMELILEDENTMDEGVADKLRKGNKMMQIKTKALPLDQTEEPQNQGQDMGTSDDQPNVKEAPKHNWFKKPERPSTPDSDWNGPKRQRFYGFASNRVSKYDVYSTKIIIAVTKVKVMKWYDYGYLEEIDVLREDQQLYKFKECDFPRLHLHDIKDMLLLLVQKKLSNLERDVIFDLGVALWMFTRRIFILKRVEDLQLDNPQGIIYVDKYKRNRLMRSDELYKFSDGTLTSVKTVLYDIASNLRMDYLPKRRWSNLNRQRSHIMIKAIDKLMLERGLMRSLEKFIGGRDYEEDF